MAQAKQSTIPTYTAGEALEQYRRVKIKSGTTTTPPEVEYADAGEVGIGFTTQAVASGCNVAVRTYNYNGTQIAIAAGAFAVDADLYAAADGKVDDTAVGSVIAKASQAATADGDEAEIVNYAVLSTTAGTVSIADAGGFTSETTVEGSLQEIYQDLITVQAYAHMPLGAATLEDGSALAQFADGASSTPGWSQEGSKGRVIRWNDNATPTPVGFEWPLPPDLDDSGDIVIHFWAKMSGATDTPVITTQAWIDDGVDVAGTDPEITGGTTLTEYTNTIAAASVSAHPGVLFFTFQPADGEVSTDDTLFYGVWIEYKRKLRTS